MRIDIKPMSVNRCWQGRRFKTREYLEYERAMLLLLPKFRLPPKPYAITLTFYVSNSASDVDNPVKPCLDILQKKYAFNDKDVFELHVRKSIVKRGREAIEIGITSLKRNA